MKDTCKIHTHVLYFSHKGSSSVHAATERMKKMKNQWKRFLSLFLCLMLLTVGFSSTALAAKTSGKCGKHAKWSYNKKTKTLTISGKGEIKDTWTKYIGWKKVKVVIKEGITTIGEYALRCTRMKKISLPKSLTTIGEDAFGGFDCETPYTVIIPKNVKKIDKYAFAACYGIKKFEVADGNKNFTAKDGVLFNKEKTVLISFPPEKGGETYTIPDGVKKISYGAFYGCGFNWDGQNVAGLKRLIVPTSVKTIKDGAFACANINDMWFCGHIPSGLANELINDDGFHAIKRVTFPEEYYTEWDSFQQKVQKENSELEWYYWW